MFSFPKLKLYRKFLVLALLLGSLAGALSNTFSANKTSAAATICCSVCEDTWDACRADCFAQYPTLPEKRQTCIENDCLPWFTLCVAVCNPGC